MHLPWLWLLEAARLESQASHLLCSTLLVDFWASLETPSPKSALLLVVLLVRCAYGCVQANLVHECGQLRVLDSSSARCLHSVSRVDSLVHVVPLLQRCVMWYVVVAWLALWLVAGCAAQEPLAQKLCHMCELLVQVRSWPALLLDLVLLSCCARK